MLAHASRILMAALVLYSCFEVKTSLTGSAADSITGTAVRVLVAVQLLGSILFFVAPYFPPEAIHFGSRRLSDYTLKQRDRIMPLVRDMTGLMGLLFALYFSVNIHLLVGQALANQPRSVAGRLRAVEPWITGGLLVGEAVITLSYVSRFEVEAGKSSDSYELPGEPHS